MYHFNTNGGQKMNLETEELKTVRRVIAKLIDIKPEEMSLEKHTRTVTTPTALDRVGRRDVEETIVVNHASGWFYLTLKTKE